MIFTPILLKGAYLLEPEPIADDRGFFARTFCQNEFADKGLKREWVQSSISFNETQGTLRGMHYQKKPHPEAKMVSCTQGAIFDVIIDLRTKSSTFGQWYGTELNTGNKRILYVPEGFAHGFLTLADKTLVNYQMSAFFHSECAGGLRWNDPAFAIKWPGEIAVISDRDAHYPDFNGAPV